MHTFYPVEERSVDDVSPSDYSGQLYSYRESQSRTILQTLSYNTAAYGVVKLGIQSDSESLLYKCVAFNDGQSANITVKISVTGVFDIKVLNYSIYSF